MIDLVLAILHHLLMFLIAAAIAGQFALIRPGLSARGIKGLAHIDRMYGMTAMAIIVVGIGRVVFGVRGWEYYVGNGAFWAKMAAFAAVGLLSIGPTRRILQWRKAAAADRYTVPDGEIAATRAFLRAQVAAFALVPIFAAMMARGIG